MFHSFRHALVLALSVTTALVAVAPLTAGTPAGAALVRPRASSHWISCNDSAVSTAPKVIWERIERATALNKGIPATYWSNDGYRDDIARIICYESSFNWHAAGAGQYGWFQMSKSLISAEHVTWDDYWGGSRTEAAGWYQCVAGERYIAGRYGTPAAAWQHEKDYGWY